MRKTSLDRPPLRISGDPMMSCASFDRRNSQYAFSQGSSGLPGTLLILIPIADAIGWRGPLIVPSDTVPLSSITMGTNLILGPKSGRCFHVVTPFITETLFQ